MIKSIDEFRSEISITELAIANGYRIIPSEGYKWPVLKNDFVGDKIIIVNPKNPANQGYWNVHDRADRGTLYHFVKNRLGSIFPYSSLKQEISNINAVLYNYLQLPVPEKNGFKKLVVDTFINQYSTSEFIKPKELRPLDSQEYLFSRGLSNESLHSKEFLDSVYNLKVGEFDNIAFPYYDPEGNIIGLDLRNKQFKQMLAGSNRSMGVWHSALPETNALNEIVLTESPIDAMSYYELKKKNVTNHTTLYIAFGGSIANGQIETMKKIVSHYGNSEETIFTSAVDNDGKGEEYHAKFLKAFGYGRLMRALPVSKDFNEDLKRENKLGIKLIR